MKLRSLQHMIRNAKRRITISTLYIGVEQQELVGKLASFHTRPLSDKIYDYLPVL